MAEKEITLNPGDTLVVKTDDLEYEIKCDSDENFGVTGIQIRSTDASSENPMYAKLRSHSTIELY